MPQGAPRWRTALLLLGLALLLHAVLLAGIASGEGVGRGMAAAGSPMQVRTIPAPSEAAPATPEAAPVPVPVPLPTPVAKAARPAPARPTAPRPADARPDAAPEPPAVVLPPRQAPPAVAEVRPPEPAASEPAATPVVAEAVASAAMALPAGEAASAVAGAGNGDDIPVYKTLFPPPLTLVYDLKRGLLSGTGTLSWRPAGTQYEARLEGRVAGLNVLTQVSEGGFDDAGIAPQRFTDQRMGREVRAANFQRERGVISFSGPANEFSLLVGTQDRLSWMVQLAAVVSAEPRRLAPGGKVAIYVVGVRADASVWVFRSAGEETVETPAGTVRAVKFTRDARGPYDTQAEAWLDPARHGLPVKARLGTGGGNDSEALELLLREFKPG